MHDSPCLSRKIHSGLIHQPELLKIVKEPVRPKPEPNINKYRIAGIPDPFHEGFGPVSAYLVAADFSVFYHPVSRTLEGIVQIHHPSSRQAEAVMILKVDPGS